MGQRGSLDACSARAPVGDGGVGGVLGQRVQQLLGQAQGLPDAGACHQVPYTQVDDLCVQRPALGRLQAADQRVLRSVSQG